MYKPGFILFLLILFIFLISCSPVNYSSLENVEPVLENFESVEVINNKKIVVVENKKIEEKNKKTKPQLNISPPLLNEISIILPINKKYEIEFNKSNLFEADFLDINSNKSRTKLKWETKYSGSKMIEKTIDWYKVFINEPSKIEQFSKKQILDTYEEAFMRIMSMLDKMK